MNVVAASASLMLRFKAPIFEHEQFSLQIGRQRPSQGRKLAVLLPLARNDQNGRVGSMSRMPPDPFPTNKGGGGMLVEKGLVYREQFQVRSSEVGPDFKITMASLMNHLQDTCVNHILRMGMRAEGFGSTPSMRRKQLGWVVASAQLVVDRYPSWGEVFQVDHWAYESGKNCLGHDWLIREGKTGGVLARASHVHVMMNQASRRMSKFVKEARDEFAPHLLTVSNPIAPRDERKIERATIESADNISTALSPIWTDLDINDHVNNIKYIDWIMEGAPRWILVSQELWGVNLQYKRECRINDGGVQSLSKLARDEEGVIELDHLLCFQDGSEIMRARTTWRPKPHLAT